MTEYNEEICEEAEILQTKRIKTMFGNENYCCPQLCKEDCFSGLSFWCFFFLCFLFPLKYSVGDMVSLTWVVAFEVHLATMPFLTL